MCEKTDDEPKQGQPLMAWEATAGVLQTEARESRADMVIGKVETNRYWNK